MKKNILVSIFLAVFQFLLLQNTFAEIQYYDSIAIVIGNKALTRNQINTVLYQENITATGNITTNTSKKIHTAIQNLINETLLEEKADNIGIKISFEKVEEKFQEYKLQNKITQEGLENLLKKIGISEKDFREKIYRRLKIEKLVQREISSNIVIAEKKLREEYEKKFQKKYKVQHILRRTTDNSLNKHTIKKDIETIKEYLLGGEEFDILAEKYSQDTATKNNKGLLPLFTLNDVVETFAQAVASMKIQEIRGPIKTQYGYHLIKLLGIVEEKEDFDVARDGLYRKLYQEEYIKNYDAYVISLKKEYPIHYYDEEIKKIIQQ